MTHQITRQRHEIKRRRLTVREKRNITPNMIRIVLGGSELKGFTSLGADDHIKLVLPPSSGSAEAERRDYTPRAYDPQASTLAVEFAVHEAGPATQWAIDAKVGDALEIAGPRGSLVVPSTFDWWLLVGDETALPAMARRLEELPAGKTVISIGAVTGPEEEQQFAVSSDRLALWVHRPLSRVDDPAPLLEILRSLEWPEGDGYIFIAGEATVVKALRRFVVEERGHNPQWIRASGYWRRGAADAHEEFND